MGVYVAVRMGETCACRQAQPIVLRDSGTLGWRARSGPGTGPLKSLLLRFSNTRLVSRFRSRTGPLKSLLLRSRLVRMVRVLSSGIGPLKSLLLRSRLRSCVRALTFGIGPLKSL